AGVNTTQCCQAVQEQFMMRSSIEEKTSKTLSFTGFSSHNPMRFYCTALIQPLLLRRQYDLPFL
ncbi:MAG: hypothetical protein RR308_18435, partial [Hafnia sp.]